MNPEHERLRSAYETASKKIKAQMNSPKGGTQAEAEFKIAYQNLVKAGLALQIKKKYR